MPTLGDILGSARRSAGSIQKWIESADPALADAVSAAVERSALDYAGFAREAVADFGRFADDEAWTRLTSMIRDGDDPGTACLMEMLRWRLAAEGGAERRQGNAAEDR